jgi:hypothetical protein
MINSLASHYESSSEFESESESEVEEEVKLKENINYVLIDSLDRDWKNKSINTFSYNVKFSPTGNSVSSTLVNNTLQTLHYLGQDNDLSIRQNFKNIKEIELMNIILPNFILNSCDRYIELDSNFDYTHYKTVKDIPYLIVEVSQIDNLVNGTNDYINKAIGIMVPDEIRDLCDTGQISESISNLDTINKKLMIFKNIQEFKKIYYPNPLNNINMLSINIYMPDGTPLKINDHTLNIKSVYIIRTLPNVSKIGLLIEKYFSRYEYTEGDDIIIDNLKFKENNDTNFDLTKIENFINGKHTISSVVNTFDSQGNVEINTSSNLGNRLPNMILINIRKSVNYTTGAIDTDMSLVSNNSSFPITDDLYFPGSSNVLTSNASGKLINKNLQNNCLFKITTLSRENVINNSII